MKTFFPTKNAYALIWKTIFIGVGVTSIIINSLYMLDYYLAMRNPFYPRRKRAKWYVIAIVLTFLPLLVMLAGLELGAEDIYLNLEIFDYTK